MSDNTQKTPANKPQKDTFETIWKYLNVIIFIYMLSSISGFLSFRSVAQANGYDFVRNEGWLIALATFFIYWVRSMI